MSSVAFDTHEAVSDIRKAGANEQLAEAIVRVVQRTADLPDISTLATKADLAALSVATKADLAALSITTKGDLAALEARLDGKIATLDGKIATMDGKLTLLLWMIGVLGLGALIVPHLHLPFLN